MRAVVFCAVPGILQYVCWPNIFQSALLSEIGMFFQKSSFVLAALCALSTAQNNHGSCDFWADNGECSANPGYMLANCKTACDRVTAEVMQSNDMTYASVPTFMCLMMTGGNRGCRGSC